MCYDKKLLDSLKESDNYIVIMLDNEHLVSFVTRDIMADSNLLEYFIDFKDHRGMEKNLLSLLDTDMIKLLG